MPVTRAFVNELCDHYRPGDGLTLSDAFTTSRSDQPGA